MTNKFKGACAHVPGKRLRGPRWELVRGSLGYPCVFENISAPPKCLYGIGNADALKPGLAVVGARKATPYGRACAEKFAGQAARRGIVIISGGARGCDAEAHRAALSAKGTTVVFLGGGCDEIYPPEHFILFQEIIDKGGAVVSEHPWDFRPLPYTFRARNRLIAGLARAVLIVEAGLPSGTFSTADEALSAGREVLVVPGAISSPYSRGANRLLFQGATPVVDDETFQDILFNVFGLLKQQDLSESIKQGKPSAKQSESSAEQKTSKSADVGKNQDVKKIADVSKSASKDLAQGEAETEVGAKTQAKDLTQGETQAKANIEVKTQTEIEAKTNMEAKTKDIAPQQVPTTEIIKALCAEPMGIEALYELATRLHAGKNARVWLMEELAQAEAEGLIARYPDGRFGSA